MPVQSVCWHWIFSIDMVWRHSVYRVVSCDVTTTQSDVFRRQWYTGNVRVLGKMYGKWWQRVHKNCKSCHLPMICEADQSEAKTIDSSSRRTKYHVINSAVELESSGWGLETAAWPGHDRQNSFQWPCLPVSRPYKLHTRYGILTNIQNTSSYKHTPH